MVSVIIATYRREESLKKAIESLKKQTYENIEIVVVDDNANVEWNKKVQKIIEENTDVKYIQNIENKGSAETRNIGIRNANGEYITFLDDDDLYLPNKVQRQVEFMKLNQLDYCVTDLDLYYENGKLCERRNRKFIKDTSSQQLLKYHLTYKITGMDTMMFQKKYLQKIGGFAPINYGDEFYLMQRAIEGNGAFGYLEGSDIMAFVHTKEQGMSIGAGIIKG